MPRSQVTDLSQLSRELVKSRGERPHDALTAGTIGEVQQDDLTGSTRPRVGDGLGLMR